MDTLKAGPSSPRLQVDADGIAEITFDAPDRSANVLSEAVMRQLAEIVAGLHESAERGEVRGVVFVSGKESSFIVGADIDEISAVESMEDGVRAARLGQAIFLDVERLPVPTVAAIHGTCMGGGTELALACRYRLVSDHPSTKIALPEVQLGILPAWGGTTRLPRLIGLRAALDLLLTGKSVDPKRARTLGLVEGILPHAGFREAAGAFLRSRIAEGPVRTGARRSLPARLLEETPPGRQIVLAAAKRQVSKRTGGHYPAPLSILDVLRSSLGRSVADALEVEATAAGRLLVSPESKALVHVFQLRERARKGTGVTSPVEELRKVTEIGVVGAGIMGGGIAQLAAYHGIRVRLKDIRHEAVTQALGHAQQLFRTAVDRRKLSEREAAQAMDLISGGVDDAGFGRLQLVVEAVVESLDVKQEVLARLEEHVPGDCVLATNTSSLSVDAMAGALTSPSRFLGMHFFNPVHKMPLVEIVRGDRTDDRTVATVYALALHMGKVPVVVRDGAGFVVNRILGPYLNEAGHLLDEGATVEQVDGAATRFGMPMGPLRLIDEVGIDVMRHAGETLYEAFGDRLSPANALIQLGESGRLGKKDGRGIYRYAEGKTPEVDRDIYPLLGLNPRAKKVRHTNDAIRDRLVLVMINEAARVLDEGITHSAGDLDLAMIMGTGFPPFRGGLLRYADTLGPDAVLDALERLAGDHGGRFKPASALDRMAREHRTFYDVFPASPT